MIKNKSILFFIFILILFIIVITISIYLILKKETYINHKIRFNRISPTRGSLKFKNHRYRQRRRIN